MYSYCTEGLAIDSDVSDTVLDDESDTDDLLAYLLQQIPPKRRKTAKGVVDLYKEGKGWYRSSPSLLPNLC